MTVIFRLCCLLVLGLLPGLVLAQGHYERIQVHGPSLEGNLSGDAATRDVSIYLPPGYEAEGDKRYPVLYFLHGFTGTDDGYFPEQGGFFHLGRAADQAWEEGARELIIVVPNAFSKFHGSMYSSSVTTGDWEAFIAEDLVAHIDANYRTIPERAARGLGGHSMGGYGTFRIAFKYPHTFGSLYAMSPCCMAPNMDPAPQVMAAAAAVEDDPQAIAEAGFGIQAMLASAAAWSPNPDKPPFYFDLPVEDGERQAEIVALWAANAPLALVHQYIPEMRGFEAIYFDAGDRDVPIVDTVHQLSALLDSYGIAHSAEEYEGDHVNRIHERFASEVLPMFSASLKFE